jgi:hypothetical protein
MNWTPLPPFPIIHDKIHQNLCCTGQGKPRDTTQPDTRVYNVPDQFRIIAASQGGGGTNGTASTPLTPPDRRLLLLMQAAA